jgi:hypothetical protein
MILKYSYMGGNYYIQYAFKILIFGCFKKYMKTKKKFNNTMILKYSYMGENY